MLDKLGWASDTPASVVAIKAYDSVQILNEAWSINDPNWRIRPRPWEHVAEVNGITGKLTLREQDYTMAGPLSIVTAEPGGEIALWHRTANSE